MKRIRLRIGLRLMLLLVALFAVFFAWLGALREMEMVRIRGELGRLEIARDFVEARLDHPRDGEYWKSNLPVIDAAIAEKRQRLGGSNR